MISPRNKAKSRSAHKIILQSHKNKLNLNKSPQPAITTNRRKLLVSPKKRLTRQQLTQQSSNVESSTIQHRLYIPNPHLRKSLSVYLPNRRMNIHQSIELDAEPQNPLTLLTTIQQFSVNYQQITPLLQTTKITWFIFTNAINLKECQKEFNQHYQPIKFMFIDDEEDVVNILNGGQYGARGVCLRDIEKIINLGAWENGFACVNEELVWDQNRYSTQKELWLIQKRSYKNFSEKNCRFLTSRFIDEGKIDKSNNTVYLLTHNFNKMLQKLKIDQRQSQILSQLPTLLSTSKSLFFTKKILINYLQDNLIYNLISFPKSLYQKLYPQFQYCLRSNQKVEQQHSKLCYVYYNETKQQRQIDRITFNKDNVIEDEVKRIKIYFQEVQKIRNQYEQARDILKGVIFAGYQVGQQEFVKSFEKFCKIQVYQCKSLQQIMQFNFKTVICFHKHPETQIIQQTKPNIHYYSISRATHPSLLNFIHDIGTNNTVSTLASNESAISINIYNWKQENFPFLSHLVKYYSISQLEESLLLMQPGSTQIVVMNLDDFQEGKERKMAEIQLENGVSIFAYLRFGNEFISRGKNGKYTFFKTKELQQLIKGIIEKHHQQKEAILQNNQIQNKSNLHLSIEKDIQIPQISFIKQKSQQIIHSKTQIQEENIEGLENIESASFLSAPIRYETFSQNYEIYFCLPRTVPIHSLTFHSSTHFEILQYQRFQQVQKLIKLKKNNTKIIAFHLSNLKNNPNPTKNAQFIQMTNMSEWMVRDQILAFFKNENLGSKKKYYTKRKKVSETILVYNQSDKKQKSFIQLMKKFVKTVRLSILSVIQFKQIQESQLFQYKIYYLGKKAQNSSGQILKSSFQAFKLFMSPYIKPLEPKINIRTSKKLTFTKNLCQQLKKSKIPSKLFQRSMSKNSTRQRSKSILNKSTLNKSLYIESGLKVICHNSLKTHINKKQFSEYFQMVEKSINFIRKGFHVLIILREDQFQNFTLNDMKENNSNIIWLVIVDQCKNFLNLTNIIFATKQHFEQDVAKIVHSFKQEQQNSQFQLKQSQNNIQINIESSINLNRSVNFVLFQKQKNYKIKNAIQINNFIFFNEKTLQKYSKKYLQKENNHFESRVNLMMKQVEQQKQLNLICEAKDRKFMEYTLQQLEEQKITIFTFENIVDILSYNQIVPTFFVLKKSFKIKPQNTIIVESKDTPFLFSKRLGLYISALRREA